MEFPNDDLLDRWVGNCSMIKLSPIKKFDTVRYISFSVNPICNCSIKNWIVMFPVSFYGGIIVKCFLTHNLISFCYKKPGASPESGLPARDVFLLKKVKYHSAKHIRRLRRNGGGEIDLQ